MIIWVPREIKNNENRVGLTPVGVAALTAGVNVLDGKITYRAVADALDLQYYPLKEVSNEI